MTVAARDVAVRAEPANYISGAWAHGTGKGWIDDVNPADPRQVLGRFRQSSTADVETAVAAATRAYPAWATISPVLRAGYLMAVARHLEARLDDLARDLSLEEGKTYREAQAEVRRAAQVFDFYAGAGHRLGGTMHPSERPGFLIQTRREPIGVVVAITPWNFPIAIPAWKMAPALVAGNAVVLKPASQAPRSAMNLLSAIAAAGLPPGVVNLVVGGGAELGEALVTHPDVAAITFTGSTDVGRRIFRLASAHYKRVQTEMGGHNPLVVLADADLEQAVGLAAEGAFASTGQKCTATRRVFVESPVYESFVDRLGERARSLRLGDPLDPATDIGPVINEEQLRLNEAGLARALAQGARVVAGGARRTDGRLGHGWFFEPTVLADVDPRSDIAQQEVFGPIVSVFKVTDLDEAIRLANDVEYGLSASICTRDLDAAERFVAASRSGVVGVNAPTAGIEVRAPLHGLKSSGLGPPEQGDDALAFFTQPKAVYIHSRGG